MHLASQCNSEVHVLPIVHVRNYRSNKQKIERHLYCMSYRIFSSGILITRSYCGTNQNFKILKHKCCTVQRKQVRSTFVGLPRVNPPVSIYYTWLFGTISIPLDTCMIISTSRQSHDEKGPNIDSNTYYFF